MAQGLDGVDEPEANAGLGAEGVEVVEVGDVREADHGDVEGSGVEVGGSRGVERGGVFFGEAEVGQVRDDA